MSQTKAQLIDPVDGTIVNADINASAAIAGSKISPSFTANTTITAASPVLRLADSTDPQSDGGSIGKIEFFGNDGSSGGVDVRSFIQTVSTNSSGNAHALVIGLGESNNAPTEKLRILGDGKVGIGTVSPGQLLHLKSSSPAIQFEDTGANGSAISVIEDNDGLMKLRNDPGNAGTGSGITFEVDASEIMRIDSSGRLLLGTTTEGVANASKFTIATSTHCGVTIRSGAAHDGQIAFSDGTSGDDEFRGQIRYNHTSNFLAIATDAVERMRIDSSGNVGIGTTPNEKLVVSGNAGVTGALFITSNTSTPSAGAFLYRPASNELAFGSNSAERMRLDSAGRLLIATTAVTGASTNADDLKIGNTDSGSQRGLTIGSAVAGNIRFADASDDTAGAIIYNHSTERLGLYANSGLRLTVDSDGLKFGSDTAAANALDDYEEGTWTPTYQNVTTPTFDVQTGRYTKVGRFVYCTGRLSVQGGTALDTSDGSGVNIGGLPFSGNSDHHVCLLTLGRFCSILQDGGASVNTCRFGGNFVMLMTANGNEVTYTECNSFGDLTFAFSYQL